MKSINPSGPDTILARPRSTCLLYLLLLATAAVTAPGGSPAIGAPVGGRGDEAGPARDAAVSGSSETSPSRGEAYSTGWTLYLDNDLFVGQDGEYTGGFAVTLSGRRAKEWFFSLDPVLGLLNDLTGFSELGRGPSAVTHHSFEIGATAFTPENIDVERPIEDDHPYAGLLFFNNVRQRTNSERDVTYQSVFSFGLLGTGVLPTIQNLTHEVTGSQEAEGWENQISDGGEPTFLYALQRQDLLYTHRGAGYADFDLKSTFGGSVGYITQLQGGFNWRLGRITTPPWSFSPDFGDYVNMGVPVDRDTEETPFPHELFLWGGLHARVRGYNALIEGQFRDSAVTFDRSELRKVIGEASLGVTCGFQTGTRVSVGVRARTPEIIDAEGSRPVWGTLILSHAY